MNRVVSQDGTLIAYDKQGQGLALIMVDAAGGSRAFRPMGSLPAQLSSRFTIFTYDRRGRGDSTDTLPYEVDREVDDLQALIDVAGGSASLYGFSSGALIALGAAARGLGIKKLALLEPPPRVRPGLETEIAELIAANRRGDAVAHFQRSTGVPAEITAQMRQAPFWPTMESVAHTLIYDVMITRSFSVAQLSALTTPTLVLASENSDERLRHWAQEVCDALPNADVRTLKGEWHGISEDILAAALTEFFSA